MSFETLNLEKDLSTPSSSKRTSRVAPRIGAPVLWAGPYSPAELVFQLIHFAPHPRQQLFWSRYQPLGSGKARSLLRWLAERKFLNSKPDLGHQRGDAPGHGHVKPDRKCVEIRRRSLLRMNYKCIDQLDQAGFGLVARRRI